MIFRSLKGYPRGSWSAAHIPFAKYKPYELNEVRRVEIDTIERPVVFIHREIVKRQDTERSRESRGIGPDVLDVPHVQVLIVWV
jgi:hypothetical protein